MPTYLYECENCGNKEDIMQKMSDKKLTYCSLCGEHKMIRHVGTSSGVFPGGWRYKDERGTIISYPTHGGAYYDKALNKTFTSKKDKFEHMRRNHLAMDGSSDKPKEHHPEAGDCRKYKPITVFKK